MDTIKLRIRSQFKELNFEKEQHQYSVNTLVMPSVSKLLSCFYEPFNANIISHHSARKQNIPREELLKQWADKRDEACERGHRVHNFAELYCFNRALKPICPQEEAVIKFFDSMPEWIVPVLVELQMYHKELLYAGTFDLLLFDRRKDAFILVDYKTNEDLFKNYEGNRLKYPFNELLDNPFNKYQLQLSLYQLLFEQTGLKVDARKLVWLLTTGEFAMYDTKDYTHELYDYLLTRN